MANRSGLKKLLAPVNFFKSKPAAAVLCSRRSTACVRQRERAQPGFERGSAQHPCQRRDWNVIYRMYRAYLSSCIFWSLAVPVASMAMLDGICEHAVTIYVPGSVQWSNKHVKSYSHPRARVHTDQGDLSRGKPNSSCHVWRAPGSSTNKLQKSHGC